MNVSRVRGRGWGTVVGLLALTLFSAPTLAGAQDFRGGIVGRVTDESGGLLPGVTITVTHRDTNVSNRPSPTGPAIIRCLFGAGNLSRRRRAPRLQEAEPGEHRSPRRRSAADRFQDGSRRTDRGRSTSRPRRRFWKRERIGRTGHRREAHRTDAALRRQPVRARAARSRRGVSRRPEILPAVR